MGPMTGRGAGYCGGFGMPGYAVPGGGRGFGRGMGRGFGLGFGRGIGWARGNDAIPFAPPAGLKPGADVERWNLERQAEILEEELQSIRGRLDTLGARS